jgi:hypothetical protein
VTLRTWFIATAAATLIVVLSAGARPWVGALAGAFGPPDFAQDIAAAQLSIEGLNPYTADFASRHAQVMGTAGAKGYPFFPHPPFAIVLSWPFGFLTLSSGAMVWYAVSLALLACLALLLAEIATGQDLNGAPPRPGPSTAVGMFMTLLFWPPVLYNLEKGQFSILLTVLFALAWRSLRQGESGRAGVLIGVAAAVKVFPLLAAGYLLRRSVRSTAWAAVTALFLTALPVLWLGPESIGAFVEQSQGNVTYWRTWPAVTYSIYGAVARLLIGGTWASAVMQAPLVAQIIVGTIGLALVVIALVVTGRWSTGDRDESSLFGAWIVLLVLLNPLSMGHNGVLLALPIAFSARALRDDDRTWVRTAWAIGVILVSIPRQTIFDLAPFPVSPLRGLLIVALPMWGALLLFTTSVVLGARRERRLVRRSEHSVNRILQGETA